MPESTEPRVTARVTAEASLLNAIWHTLSVSLAEAKAAVPLIRDRLARDGLTIAPTEPGRDKIVMEFSEPTLTDFIVRNDRDGLFRFVEYATSGHRYRVAAAERADGGGE